MCQLFRFSSFFSRFFGIFKTNFFEGKDVNQILPVDENHNGSEVHHRHHQHQ